MSITPAANSNQVKQPHSLEQVFDYELPSFNEVPLQLTFRADTSDVANLPTPIRQRMRLRYAIASYHRAVTAEELYIVMGRPEMRPDLTVHYPAKVYLPPSLTVDTVIEWLSKDAAFRLALEAATELKLHAYT